ncbi:hypothetical protein [Emticicia sp. 21SJ11W-3]|uniref:hypothetical protein n=1 Tax=Emticicia sp. 21SJ11W-3 TaxID=2916755 RepID=UPI00209E4754|nr:hypothetical protein [Emticicia sp. 21SJ11W-3]UTA67271.1 hypothetical protein MB380_16905 [Emticicia sp. 21SJ11W-3]
MLNITCFVGKLRPSLNLNFPLLLDNRGIEEYFLNGSMDTDGNPAIKLSVDDRTRFTSSIIPDDRPTTAFYLQQSLAHLTQNTPNLKQANNIGLILADSFKARPGLLGMMFDFGFNPSGLTPVSEFFTSVPREGCAIFLDAIESIRPNIDDFRREVLFTAIHELGHVFNLWHIENPKTFMATSDTTNTFPSSAYLFNFRHRAFLHEAPIDNHVWPGGTKFGDRGSLGPSEINPFNKPHVSKDIKMEISINQKDKEFWYFEPVELSIKLENTNSKKNVTIPDKIDPGYEDFIIFITRPDGSIFKYRSPRIYCQNEENMDITTNSYLRDISIFGQSGGYTFSNPGIYRIQCFFKLKYSFLTSNVLEIHIKDLMLNNSRFLKLRKFLTFKDIALLLYHRNGYFSKTIINEIEEYCKGKKLDQLKTNLLYSLTRYLTHENYLPVKTRQKSMNFINKSLDSNYLSENQIKNLLIVRESL